MFPRKQYLEKLIQKKDKIRASEMQDWVFGSLKRPI